MPFFSLVVVVTLKRCVSRICCALVLSGNACELKNISIFLPSGKSISKKGKEIE